MKRVYLAGGMRTLWRDAVMASAPDFEYLDPSRHGLTDEFEYTKWDLEAIERCDILFAFLEETNPSGYGLMVEIGVAWTMGKTIIFADSKPMVRRYTGMARVMSTHAVDNLSDAIVLLGRYQGA